MARSIAEQFTAPVDSGDPEIDQWTMRMLGELLRDQDPIGAYARVIVDVFKRTVLD
jgi:hypothetical protein